LSTEKKVPKVKELFVQDLARIRGGQDAPKPSPQQPVFTTLACEEEIGGGC
jgi:hypothetical protein